jgi:hypothetical protein
MGTIQISGDTRDVLVYIYDGPTATDDRFTLVVSCDG